MAARIQSGADPLGSAFCRLRSAETRRVLGATYTPAPIVSSILRWATAQGGEPARIVEPGAGSARFLLAAGRRFKTAELLAIEIDPVPAMIARANLAAAGFSKRSLVLVGDYRSIVMLESPGATLYVGNPPYVRHHQIDATAKQWLTTTAAQLGHDPSQLSGLHVYFFLVTAMKARVGDFGAFITAAEWLDVNCRRMFPTKVQGYEIRRWRKHAPSIRLF